MKIVSFFFAAVFYIYILFSIKANKYYIGLTTDISQRLNEHNNQSRLKKFTSKYIPWELKLFFQVSENRGEAQIVERFVKKQKSRCFLEKLIEQKDDPDYFAILIKNILQR